MAVYVHVESLQRPGDDLDLLRTFGVEGASTLAGDAVEPFPGDERATLVGEGVDGLRPVRERVAAIVRETVAALLVGDDLALRRVGCAVVADEDAVAVLAPHARQGGSRPERPAVVPEGAVLAVHVDPHDVDSTATVVGTTGRADTASV